ncbi:MAG: transcriptional regulator, Crp/Fnr family [Bacteroidetes bacterium]|nr:transcriptional regulator, Crp/Fnr family [Bacteroidota bacterium]
MKKILLIEDNTEVRENTAEILELARYNVITAENGKIGVELAAKEKPDLIICDIMMPVLDGYGVLHLLSKQPETALTPFIFLSAKTERNDIRKGMEMGADDYLTKPFDDIELLNAVESRFHKAELIKKEFENNSGGIARFLDSATQLKLISDDRETCEYKKKTAVYSEGSRPIYLYYVKSGKVKTYRTNEDGKELITGMYKEGDFIGYIALLEEHSYKDTAEVLEAAELMLIPKTDFLQLVNSSPEISKKFISLLANNVSEREMQLLKLAYNSLRKRVADALLMVNKRYKKDETENPQIQISREDLANLVGTATESLIRTLSDFKSEQLIEIKEGKITICSEAKLAGLLN